MARHWSAYTDVSTNQGIALDRMARQHGIGDGMDLLMRLTGGSRSKVGKMDYASLRPFLDDAFERYGQPPRREPAPLTAAVEAGLARVNGEGAAAAVSPRDAALVTIRSLMAEHGIAAEDMR